MTPRRCRRWLASSVRRGHVLAVLGASNYTYAEATRTQQLGNTVSTTASTSGTSTTLTSLAGLEASSP